MSCPICCQHCPELASTLAFAFGFIQGVGSYSPVIKERCDRIIPSIQLVLEAYYKTNEFVPKEKKERTKGETR